MNRHAPAIRRASRIDLDALLALEEATFNSDRISRRQWRQHLDSRSASVLVCGAPGEVEAVAVVFYRRNTRQARLYSLAVHADRRGMGLGALLLAATENDARRRGCRSMTLEVSTRNRAAIALYKRFGYLRVTRLPQFYEDATDAWRYAKALQPA